jgi:hypothetical protein
MADKSQKRSSKEIRKPKKDKGKSKQPAAAAAAVISAVSQKEKK